MVIVPYACMVDTAFGQYLAAMIFYFIFEFIREAILSCYVYNRLLFRIFHYYHSIRPFNVTILYQ